MNTAGRPDVAQVLSTLKDFQRDTVDYVFDRLYSGSEETSRFLIADEVGLGKTLVARGITAKAIDYLWETQPAEHRIDVVYVCSNQAIAQQNIDRLNVTTEQKYQFASRLTLLPVTVQKLESNKLNFVSLTPGTSFNLQSSGGVWSERIVLYRLLQRHWDVSPGTLKNVLRGTVSKRNWNSRLRWFARERDAIDTELRRAFCRSVDEHPALRAEYDELAAEMGSRRTRLSPEIRHRRAHWTGRLRRLLARASIGALEPDLIILDEFQRFKHLLGVDDEVGLLAQEMFTFPGAKVLLLSATPYKMYTLNEDDEHHYEDFLQTARFLLNGKDGAVDALEEAIDQHRVAMFRLGRGAPERELREAKDTIEDVLRGVMVRTERLSSSPDRNGMVTERFTARDRIQPRDLEAFVHLDAIASELQAGDQVEYWKSASYPLNLMDGYQLKRLFKDRVEGEDASRLAPLIRRAQAHLLSWDQIEAYTELDPGNARLRAICEDTVNTNNWRLLWMPPALPYTRPAGLYAGLSSQAATKALIFSAWRLVPKCVSMLLSYEAERRMLEEEDQAYDYSELSRQRRPLLRFTYSNERLTGMPVFCLTYPCATLARELDPLSIAAGLRRESGELPTLAEIRAASERVVRGLLEAVLADSQAPHDGREDEAWYWAALALLDRRYSRDKVAAWLRSEDEDLDWRRMVEARDDDGRFSDHVNLFAETVFKPSDLGRPPDDLVDVLVSIALGSPAVAALRSLVRAAGPATASDWAHALHAAARIGMGFRTLYNQPEAIPLLQSNYPDGVYWQKALAYAADGNVQAVLDEYVHILHESLGLVGHGAGETAQKIASEAHTALTIRPSQLVFDDISADEDGNVLSVDRRIRCRYALQFGEDRSTGTEERFRPNDVRIAFNSPFRPFVLATTSVGQEGLDFHQYCHRVVHWNLPSNPVDLEQREGRVHRYKGHAIRRNLAERYGLPAGDLATMAPDPWRAMFQHAVDDRSEDANDLVPFWVFLGDEGDHPVHTIERLIPVLPLSREIGHLKRLKEALVAYRSVIGQPRQEELLAFLTRHLGTDRIEKISDLLRIDLSPPRRSAARGDQ